MRALFLTLLLLATPAAAAGPEVTFAERSALLGADRACGLFTPSLRSALDAATAQARGAVLRSGWTELRTDSLAASARAEGARRRCDDPLLQRTAESARQGFAGWARLPSMRFAGGTRIWMARRTQDPDKFYLRQDIDAPHAAAFGLREDGRRASVTLRLPLAAGESAPSSARIYFRDRARAPRSAADLPGRTRNDLPALAASRAAATVVIAQARHVETGERGRAALFVFPDSALHAMAVLDPREAATIELDTPKGLMRLYLEIGDLGAARAFLAAQPGA
jgi:hypothetical protein